MSWIKNSIEKNQKMAENLPKFPTVLNITNSVANIYNSIWGKKCEEVEKTTLLGIEFVHKQKYSFICVQAEVQDFVENYVSEKATQLFNLLNQTTEQLSAKELNEKVLLEILDETIILLKEIFMTFEEVNNIKNFLLKTSDEDDFNFLVSPAKKKVWNIIVYFFEVHSARRRNIETSCKRSLLARDLVSLMKFPQSDLPTCTETGKSTDELKNALQDCNSIAQEINSFRTIPESFLKSEKLMELHRLLVKTHDIVEDNEEDEEDARLCNVVERESSLISENNRRKGAVKVVKRLVLPVLGCVVGGAVAGPVGMMAGAKVGTCTTAITAFVGAAGSALGYKGGKMINNRHSIDVDLGSDKD